MPCWQAVGEQFLYLTLVLSVLKTDVHQFNRFENYPEVQETIFGDALVPLTADYHLDRLRARKQIDDDFLTPIEAVHNEINLLARSLSNVGTCSQEICTGYLFNSNESAYDSAHSATSQPQEPSLNMEDGFENYNNNGDYSSYGTVPANHDSPTATAGVPDQYMRMNSLEQELLELTMEGPELGFFELAPQKEPESHPFMDMDSSFIPADSGHEASGWDSQYLMHGNRSDYLLSSDQYLYERRDSNKISPNYTSLPSTSSADPSPTLEDLQSMEFDYSLLDEPGLDEPGLDGSENLEMEGDLLEGTDMDEFLHERYMRNSISDDSAVSLDGSLSTESFSEAESFSSFEGSGDEIPDFSVLRKREPSSSPYDRLLEDLRTGPLSKNVSHNHTYSAPFGGVPHVRKMDIKVEREATRGDAHDEILMRKLRIPFDLETIINIPVDQFNRLMKKNKLSNKQIELIKDIRRRGKNKVAAHNCRTKKMGALSDLEQEMENLRRQKDTLTASNTNLKWKSDILNRQIEHEESEVLRHLKKEDGSLLHPSKYTVEIDEHGNIHAAPINLQRKKEKSKNSYQRHKY